MTIAKAAGKPPRAVAEAIVARLPRAAIRRCAEATIAGPGFINLRLAPAFWQRLLPAILAAGDDWGRGAAAPGAEDRARVPVGEPDRADHGRARAALPPSATR